MASLDLKSTLVAGAIGAAAFALISYTAGLGGTFAETGTGVPPGTYGGIPIPITYSLLYGFIIGVAVQTGVRLIGVS